MDNQITIGWTKLKKISNFVEHLKNCDDIESIKFVSRSNAPIRGFLKQMKKLGQRSTYSNMFISVFDNFHSLRLLREQYVDQTNTDPAASKDPYLLARIFRGWTGKVESALRYGQRDHTGMKKIGPGLKQILDPVKDQLKEFKEYQGADNL